MYICYIHIYLFIFIYISAFKYWKPVVHWYPWFQTNTTGLNTIFFLPFHICDFFFWQWEIWFNVFTSAFLWNPCPMHIPNPSHWLWQPVWNPSFPYSHFNPLAAPCHSTGALLTSPRPRNSLWAYFPPHVRSFLISSGLWFSTLDLWPHSHHM